MDPVSETVAATMGRPIFVIPKQDHMAHIQTHMAFLKSPLFGGSPFIANSYLFPMASHLRDHLLNYYLVEAHNAVDMAHREGLIQEEASEQVSVIIQVQQFIEQQLGQFGQELAQITQQAQQFAPQPQMPPDSSMQIAQLNAQIQGQALQQRAQADQARAQMEQAKMQQDAALKQAELAARTQESQQEVALKQAEIANVDKRSQLELAREQMRQQAEAQMREKQQQLELAREQMRQSGDDQRTVADLTVRERMNTADNRVAMDLAQLEIATGEKFSVSTGTGINPGAR
jgi:hypothetical protein